MRLHLIFFYRKKGMQDKSLLVFLRVEVTEIAGAPRKK
jgi:hypothetical protein